MIKMKMIKSTKKTIIKCKFMNRSIKEIILIITIIQIFKKDKVLPTILKIKIILKLMLINGEQWYLNGMKCLHKKI